MTTQERTIAEEIFVTTEGMNDQKRDQEKRWGLRPHRVSFFAAYDFTRAARGGRDREDSTSDEWSRVRARDE